MGMDACNGKIKNILDIGKITYQMELENWCG